VALGGRARCLAHLQEFNPYHKPAGSPEGGQFTSGPGGGSAADAGAERPATLAMGTVNPATHKLVLQPANNVKVLLTRAEAAKVEYEKRLEELATAAHAQTGGVRVKKDGPRLHRKLVDRQPQEVSDYLAGRVVFDRPIDIDGFVTDLKRRGFTVVADDNFLDKPKFGYRARHLQVLLPGKGLSAELSLIPVEIWKVQEQAHKAYEVIGDATATPEQKIAAAKESARIFDEAWARQPGKMIYAAESGASNACNVAAEAGGAFMTSTASGEGSPRTQPRVRPPHTSTTRSAAGSSWTMRQRTPSTRLGGQNTTMSPSIAARPGHWIAIGGRVVSVGLTEAYREEDHPRDARGRWTDKGGGARNPAERAQAERHYKTLRAQWQDINADLFALEGQAPDAPEVQAKIAELKQVVKMMYRLDVDPGGEAGIGQPGGLRDVVVIGGGPGGLSVAIGGGTEGLDTLVIEAQERTGGQAKYTSRVENYPGFPPGTTGTELAGDMYDQAERLGAEVRTGLRVTKLEYDPETEIKTLTLSNGETIQTRAVVIAGGVEARRGRFPGADAPTVSVLNGEQLKRDGRHKSVVVLGGANSAAQAVLGLRQAAHVTILSRSPFVDAEGKAVGKMSAWQVDALKRLERQGKLTIVQGDDIASYDPATGQVMTRNGLTIPAAAVGVFYGGAPKIDYAPLVTKTPSGHVVVGQSATGQPREPLETNIPGVFAVGDARDGAGGRIVAAVGDGGHAVKQLFGYFGRAPERVSGTAA
jgi:thioredoxin reductase